MDETGSFFSTKGIESVAIGKASQESELASRQMRISRSFFGCDVPLKILTSPTHLPKMSRILLRTRSTKCIFSAFFETQILACRSQAKSRPGKYCRTSQRMIARQCCRASRQKKSRKTLFTLRIVPSSRGKWPGKALNPQRNSIPCPD